MLDITATMQLPDKNLPDSKTSRRLPYDSHPLKLRVVLTQTDAVAVANLASSYTR